MSESIGFEIAHAPAAYIPWESRAVSAIGEARAEQLALLDESQKEQVISTISEAVSPIGIDWATPAGELDLATNLGRLARVKTLLTPKNIEDQKDQHNISLENYTKLLIHSAGDTDTLRIFLEMAAETLDRTEPEDANMVAQQALHIWAPAAEIGGWYDVKTRLEEAAFERLYPEEKSKIIATYVELGGDEALQAQVEAYREGIGSILSDYEGEDISYKVMARKKSYFSIWRKRVRDERPDYFLPDFYGVRVIIDDENDDQNHGVEQCYGAANILSQYFEPIPERYKDYIADPMPNGYQGIHLGVRDITGDWLELQVKTQAMHDAMETDPNRSHIMYEANNKITPGKYLPKRPYKSPKIYKWRGQAERAVHERAQAGDTSLDGVTGLDVLVFSFDGNVYELREGDTALDFAFAVHSDRALRTQTIYVNDKPAKFNQVLRFGDKVYIDYHPKDQPRWSDSWQKRVQSDKAAKRIKRAVKERDEDQLVGVAVGQVEAHFQERGVSNPMGMLTDEERSQIAQKYGQKSFRAVLREIGARSQSFGIGRIVNRVEAHLAGPSETQQDSDSVKRLGGVVLKDRGTEPEPEPSVAILGTLNCNYHLAGCCLDHAQGPIVATISPRHGDFSIHKAGCVNLPTDKPVLTANWYQPAPE